jgi:hypothetical protein
MLDLFYSKGIVHVSTDFVIIYTSGLTIPSAFFIVMFGMNITTLRYLSLHEI